ncbi:MAG: zonular occludens toxin domain-containing protein [Alysiella sp.]|uniref:zonular occludens toxin domain-containing protein n=1 Tax=Alysiella sp. TaxID=1872483 RepID=UPI0026DDA0EC|nr:zonular occludens toxin domain-containing protein [Alysiella sp.]MDO4433720.1 zonular occludens toxin domain-containing protein [Alysiella sp.]
MAEIVLITGKPGAGKTAHMVHLMLTDPIFKDQSGNLRKVFSNIKELQLPHIQVSSIQSEQAYSTDEQLSFHDCYQWIKKEENLGSIIIIDEVQDVYPARSNGSKVPENVSWLNTHRHLGVDIFILTQDPKDIDSRVRNLVGKHYHIAKNKLGMRTLLEWKYCANNPLTQSKDALAKIHKINDKVKDLYKSAEIHTQNHNKRSKWVFVLPITILLIPIMFYMSYTLLKNMGKDTTEQAAQNTETISASAPISMNIEQQIAAQNALQNPQQNRSLTAEMFIPTLAERPESKPIYDSIRQVKQYERIAACIKGGKSDCTCYSDQATKLREITKEMCIEYAENGLPFDPFRDETQPNQQVNTNETVENHKQTQIAVMGGEVRPTLTPDYPENLKNIQ